MSLAILDSSSLDRNKWAKLVTVSESSTFYHTLDWSLVWEKSFDFCQPLFFVEEKNSEYSLGLPVVKFKKKGLESFFSMPMGTYGGLIYLKVVESEAEEFLRQVLTRLNNKRDLRLQIVDYFDRFPFMNRLGLVKKDGFTHLLDLRGVALKQLLVKRGFQQSVKRGVKIRMIDNKKDLA